MLRASSLGLAFTHGISRLPLLQRHRLLHKQFGHDTVLHVHGTPRTHSTTKKVAVEMAMAEGFPESSRPPTLSLMRENRPPSSKIKSQTSDRPRPVTRSPGPSPRQRPSRAKPQPLPTRRRPASRSSGPSPQQRPSRAKSQPLPSRPRRVRSVPSNLPSKRAFEEHLKRRPQYKRLTQVADIDKAWKTYQNLLSKRPPHVEHLIPHKYLHRFAARLVAYSRWMPPSKELTQTVFHRLLSVLNTLYYSGGQIRLWEWNALLHHSGMGWRKTRADDLATAQSIFRDMVDNRAPGSSMSAETYVSFEDESRVRSQPVEPDIVTYTTLLNIAGRTLNETALQVAERRLVSAGHTPNRITQLAYMRYFTRKSDLAGVRSVLSRMTLNKMELGIDGANACIWAFGSNGRLDVASLIYRILRHHILPVNEADSMANIRTAVRELAQLEGITIPTGLKPDAVTYYALIQAYAYHGRLHPCLAVFSDMMTSPSRVTGPVVDAADKEVVSGPSLPNPILPIFRAIFLGFARHGEHPKHATGGSAAAPALRQATPTGESWTLEQLRALFENFIDLPQDAKPNSRTVYWLLVAFAITSGYDREILRAVWERLSARYGPWWDGRVDRFRGKIYAETLDEEFFERVQITRKPWKRGDRRHS